METRVFKSSELTAECWMVQMRGLAACEACEFVNTRDCGGKKIRKTGKNANGKTVPLGSAV